MSITRTLLRVATVQSLVDETLAGPAVFDSIVDPLDSRISNDGKRPVLVVYTDDQIGSPSGKSDYFQGGGLDLVIEIVVAGRILVSVGDEDDEVSQYQLAIPDTDAGLEVTLDLIEAQAIKALTGGEGPWAKTWRNLCMRVTKVVSRRGRSNEAGTRFAIRQVTITCDTLVDPDRGAPLSESGPWLAALRLMNEVDGLSAVAEILLADLQGRPRTDWRRAAARLGVNLETISALGLGPVGADDPVPLVEVGAEGEVTT